MSGSNFSLEEAKLKIERYCAYQDRCVFEVTQKLHEFGLTPESIESIVAQLNLDWFLDDKRFAISYASGKMRIKHWGRIKIKQGLKLKRISSEYIQEALSQLDEHEYLSIIQKLIAKKQQELSKEKELA